MGDINTIAKQFTDFYYTTFDTNRAGLQSLYVRVPWACAINAIDAYPSTSVYLGLFSFFLCTKRADSMLSWEGSSIQGASLISEKLTVRFNDRDPRPKHSPVGVSYLCRAVPSIPSSCIGVVGPAV